MRINGVCDFCNKKGDWEAGLYRVRMHAKKRPVDWAAIIPWNRFALSKDTTFDAKSLKQHGATTRLACPKCYRKEN